MNKIDIKDGKRFMRIILFSDKTDAKVKKHTDKMKKNKKDKI